MTDAQKPYTVRGADQTRLNLWRVYGVDRGELIWSSLSSGYDRLLFAHHHLKLLRKVAKPAVELGLGNSGFLMSTDKQEDTAALFSQSMHQTKMHVTDCIQRMHAVGDTVAFAIYFVSEVPEPKRLKRQDITLFSVKKLLAEIPAWPHAACFLPLLERFTCEDYVYLADLNNHAKHRSIVKPLVRLPDREVSKDISEEEYRDWLIFSTVEMSKPAESLKNRGATPVHGQRPILPFIESELARIWDIYGAVRQEIERQVQLVASSTMNAATPSA